DRLHLFLRLARIGCWPTPWPSPSAPAGPSPVHVALAAHDQLGAFHRVVAPDLRIIAVVTDNHVTRLVGTATAYREVDAEDRRKVRVYLSARGRQAHRRIASKIHPVERALLDSTGNPTAA